MYRIYVFVSTCTVGFVSEAAFAWVQQEHEILPAGSKKRDIQVWTGRATTRERERVRVREGEK